MKLSLASMMLTCLLSACCEDATVLSFEGDKVKAYCSSLRWVECAQTACPTGYTIVKTPKDDGNLVGIIKCNKP